MNKGIVVIALFAAFVSTAADWPSWRGPKRNGVSTETGLNPKGIGKKVWSGKIGSGYSSITIKDGNLFALGNVKGEDVLYCLDAATGNENWRYSYACPSGGGYKGPRATPIVADGRVYTFSRNGRLGCVDVETGKSLWSVTVGKYGADNLSWQFSGSPLVFDGKVFVNAGEKGMAFNAKSGAKIWASSGKGGYATPVSIVFRKKKYVAMFGFNALRIVEARNGKVAASCSWPTKYNVNAADPVVTAKGSKIFITSGYGNAGALFKFNGRSLKQIWKNKAIKGHLSTPVLFEGNLYAADGNTGGGALVCVSLETGRELWREKSVRYGSLIIADDKIFYLRDRGILIVCKASPKGFAKLAEAKLFHGRQNWIVPALADGRLYCRGANGELVCMNLK
ncbi:MAG: PQQ-binding-like beta-propeller repeat protein [Kiritimatiellaeota bacterium]|nr:PQQ-binding-like beta-propeller repeat protein [Kiritimatiellota bacterium]